MSQATPSTEDLPFHLKGNFAPVFEELTEFDLEVSGAIPPELNGLFFRNGSNPQSGFSFHWFMGNGMIHGVKLSDGKAVWYRNRYVKTPLLDDPDSERMNTDGSMDRTRSCANTHVISHGGRFLALEEASFPFEITDELETVGVHTFDGKLKSAMTAHPRVCPETGELLFFGVGQFPPHLTYHRVAPDGTLAQSEEIDVKGPTMMHDWNVTRNHVIFMDLPMIFDPAAMASGGMPLRWSEEYGARLGVMPRTGSNADVVWYEIDPCYVFHGMNAYEDGDKIVLDVSRFERLSMSMDDSESTPPVLTRWVIDQAAGSVSSEQIDDLPADFPRISDRCVGLEHRYGYMAGIGSALDNLGASLYKYDRQTGQKWTHELDGGQAGEPVFAQCPGADGEDAGWILTFVYDPTRDKSDLVTIDATNFDKPPVAKIHMPTRVPFGFHGSWIADGV
ncbi:MAG: carotenoid oxygenase family protein [Myxococcota bacterium]